MKVFNGKTVKYCKKNMYSDLMKCTMKMNYNGIYTCINSLLKI